MIIYYGLGNVTMEGGTNIRGISIKYRGAIEIDDKTPDGYAIGHQNNKIMIFPIATNAPLSSLFDYVGEFTILSAQVTDGVELLPVTIKKVLDYSELLTSNSEDLTVKSEDLSAGHTHVRKVGKTALKQPIIENLDTKRASSDLYNNKFYLEDGTEYNGLYHVHLKDSSAMTGGVHDENSQGLYFKQFKDGELIDKLVPTKNPSHKPQGLAVSTRATRRTTRRTTKQIQRQTTGGGY